MKRMIIGNWKMNPDSFEEARRILNKIKRVSVDIKKTSIAIAPPFVFMQPISKSVTSSKSKLILGSQNVSLYENNSSTGEVSIEMLKKIGVSICIVGHSERRHMGEKDEEVATKVKRLIKNNISPVVCIGEEVRGAQGEHLDFLKNQIKNSLLGVQKRDSHKIIIAYEPVWAIGAPAPMESKDIHESVLFVRKVLADIFGSEIAFRIPVLYGGSVNGRNAGDIIKVGQTDGLLVGRESLNTSAFSEIIREVDKV